MFSNFDHKFAPIPTHPASFRFCRFFYVWIADTVHWCKLVSSTNVLVHYKENQNASRTSLIRLNIAYSIGWSGAETETHVFKMAAISETKECGYNAS
jgi:hypothetical protein